MKIIPEPKKITDLAGEFCIDELTGISIQSSDELFSAQQLSDSLYQEMRLRPHISSGRETRHAIRLEHSVGQNDQAYRLQIYPDRILITGTKTGIFYGVQTFIQLVRNYHNQIPCMEIEDWPDFPVRGFLHDVARGKIPRLETLKRLIDQLAFLKYNQLQLNIEHTFAFPFLTESWSGKDALQPEEILELDQYCKQRCIELVPTIATFGHMHDILLTQSYQHLNELEHPVEEPYYWTSKAMHYTLDVANPESFQLVKKMLDDFLPLFSSDKCNLCGDETLDLGKGRNKERAEREGTGKLYADFVKKIIDYIRSCGKTAILWADIMTHYPDQIKEIAAEDVIALSWGYKPKEPDTSSKLLSEGGMRQYVCPSTQAPWTFLNRYDDAYANIKQQVSHGVRYQAEGVLLTNWGDIGDFCMISSSLPLVAFGAENSWNASSKIEVSEFEEAYSMLIYGNKQVAGLLRSAMEHMTMDWRQISFWTYEHCGYYTDEVRKYIDFQRNYQEYVLDPKEEWIHQGFQKATSASQQLLSLIPVTREEEKDDLWEMYCMARGTALLYSFHLIVKKYFGGQTIWDTIYTPKELATQLELWFEQFRACWYHTNKQGEIFRNADFIHLLTKILRQITTE